MTASSVRGNLDIALTDSAAKSVQQSRPVVPAVQSSSIQFARDMTSLILSVTFPYAEVLLDTHYIICNREELSVLAPFSTASNEHIGTVTCTQ